MRGREAGWEKGGRKSERRKTIYSGRESERKRKRKIKSEGRRVMWGRNRYEAKRQV